MYKKKTEPGYIYKECKRSAKHVVQLIFWRGLGDFYCQAHIDDVIGILVRRKRFENEDYEDLVEHMYQLDGWTYKHFDIIVEDDWIEVR